MPRLQLLARWSPITRPTVYGVTSVQLELHESVEHYTQLSHRPTMLAPTTLIAEQFQFAVAMCAKKVLARITMTDVCAAACDEQLQNHIYQHPCVIYVLRRVWEPHTSMSSNALLQHARLAALFVA